MVKRLDGFRKRTRKLLKKSISEKGKIKIRNYLQVFSIGERAHINFEPAYHKGMCSIKFHNKQGKIIGKRGKCYELLIYDGGKQKKLIVHPIHLKKAEV